jgi:hypothetical protein
LAENFQLLADLVGFQERELNFADFRHHLLPLDLQPEELELPAVKGVPYFGLKAFKI